VGRTIHDWQGWPFLSSFVFPNVYFHITTAYDLLRHNALVLGKRDFLGERRRPWIPFQVFGLRFSTDLFCGKTGCVWPTSGTVFAPFPAFLVALVSQSMSDHTPKSIPIQRPIQTPNPIGL